MEAELRAYSPEVEGLVLKAVNTTTAIDKLLAWKKEGHNIMRFCLSDPEGKAPIIRFSTDIDVFLRGSQRILMTIWEELAECGEQQMADDLIRPNMKRKEA